MAVYLIGYDLKHRHMSDYQNLFAAIKALDSDWWHCLDSTWLINHPGPASVIWHALVTHMHNTGVKNTGDRLLVVQVIKDVEWTMSFPQDCHDWLFRHLT